MTKKYVFALLAVSVSAHAGFYVGGNIGSQNMDPKLRTADLHEDTDGDGNNIGISLRNNSLIGGVFAGYDHFLGKMAIGAEASFDWQNYEAKKEDAKGDDAVARLVINPFNVKVKSNYGIGIMPKITFLTTEKLGIGLGIKFNLTEFEVEGYKNTDRSAFEGTQKKRLFGYEPTLFAAYKMTDKFALRFSVGVGFYNTYKTKDLTPNPTTRVSLKIKPRTYNAKLGLVYSF